MATVGPVPRPRHLGPTLTVLALIAGTLSSATNASSAASYVPGKQLAACANAQARQEARVPKSLTTPVPAPLTSVLGVLRPPSPTTKLPAKALRKLVPHDYSGLWLDSVVLLRSEPKAAIYLIPGVLSRPPLPRACRKSLSTKTFGLYERARRRANGPVVVVAFVTHELSIGVPVSAKELALGETHVIGLPALSTGETFDGLVPDGVASVAITLDGVTTTALVQSNFYVAHVAQLHAGNHPYTVQWLSATGELLKTSTSSVTILETTFSVPLGHRRGGSAASRTRLDSAP